MPSINEKKIDELTKWFSHNLIVSTPENSEKLSFEIDAERPRYGSLHSSPFGLALCLYSDLPSVNDAIDHIAYQLGRFHRSTTPSDEIPPFYALITEQLKTKPKAYWFLSHYIDNEVLSCTKALPFDRSVTSYFKMFKEYETIQTDSRRLSLLSADHDWLLDYHWDSENFTIFYHGAQSKLESLFQIKIPEPIIYNADSDCLSDLGSNCQWGGSWPEIQRIDARYHLQPHEWHQVKAWLRQRVTAASEVHPCDEAHRLIDGILKNGGPR